MSDSDRVVGAHMVGPDAGEIIQGLGVALKAGATKAQFDATIGIHPDGGRGIRDDARGSAMIKRGLMLGRAAWRARADDARADAFGQHRRRKRAT